jgi:hypothetical protein
LKEFTRDKTTKEYSSSLSYIYAAFMFALLLHLIWLNFVKLFSFTRISTNYKKLFSRGTQKKIRLVTPKVLQQLTHDTRRFVVVPKHKESLLFSPFNVYGTENTCKTDENCFFSTSHTRFKEKQQPRLFEAM